jgi:hypothetical protein
VKLKIRVAPQRTTVRFQTHCLLSAVDLYVAGVERPTIERKRTGAASPRVSKGS